MTWLNPVAFFGLLALAVPILVHLFGRHVAKRQRFPSLRLLMDSRPTPATRSRPSDLLLLLIRCGIVLAAVLALAQPRWSSASRMRDASIPARLILVDTSGSMHRRASDGSALRSVAQLTAQRLLDSAREGMIVETERPGANVAGAASWLARRAGLRELVVLSDFQVGALSDGDLAGVPEGLGVTLSRVGEPLNSVATVDANQSAAVSAGAEPSATHGAWRFSAVDSILPFTVMAAPGDSEKVRTMLAAVRSLVPNLDASGNRVLIAFPGSRLPQDTSSTLTRRWQGDLLVSLRGNRLLADAMHSADVEPSCLAAGAVVAHQGFGFHAATVMAADSGLVVQSCARAGSVAGTALLAAVAMALAPVPSFTERETSVLPDETLRTWERRPTEMAPRGREETSPDGRWFWLLAIALLVIEQVVRRGKLARSEPRVTEARRERVA
jgi:hypothetical protein